MPDGPAGRGDGPSYRRGLAYLFVATLFTSLAGVTLRLIEEADGWQVLFYRSLAFVATMALFTAWRHRGGTVRAFLAVGRPGLVMALCLGSATMLFVFAMLQTTVAAVVFTVGLSPFFAALFAWVAMREPVAPSTWAAMALSIVGIGFMVGDGLAGGAITGNLLALVCCLCFSAGIVAMRMGRAVDMVPAVCLAGVVAATVSGVMAADLEVTRHDLALAVFMGVVQLGIQYMLITAASRAVPAAEVTLIGRLTLVLAPLWVWLAVGEVPGALVMVGGLIVFAAISGHGLVALLRKTGPAT